MAGAAMILDPILPVWLIAVTAVVLGVSGVWQVLRGPAAARRPWMLRLLMLVLLVAIALRPSIPGSNAGPTATGGLDVYFVVDTTSSMAAEDVELPASALPEPGVPGTRLDAAAADIGAIARALPGAQFSLTTFDASPVQRMPLTSDTSALASATSALTPEISQFSEGSSIDAALPLLTRLLTEAEEEHPDRRRVLFYLGDGEQTREQPPKSFAELLPFLDGGAVLGYGTGDGGPMRVFDGYSADDDPAEVSYIRDPSTGSDALSRIDEANLAAIGDQLGVPYRSRTPAQPIDGVVAGIDVGDVTVEDDVFVGPVEFYWILAFPLGVLALRELLATGVAIAELRGGNRARGSGGGRAS